MTTTGSRLTVFDSFAAAEDCWRAFEGRAAFHAFQRFDWLRAWHEEIGDDTRPLIVHLEAGRDHPEMLLPLGVAARRGTRVLTWLGGAVSDYHGPLIAPGPTISHASFRALWADVRRALPGVDALHLQKQPALIGGIDNPFVVNSSALHHLPSSAVTVSPDRRARDPGRLRTTSRRRIRQLEKLGGARFVVADEPTLAEELTLIMMEQKSQRYRETGAWDVFANPAYRDFYLRATQEGAASGQVHVSALACGEAVIATYWCLVGNGTCYGIMPGHDVAWRPYSPGIVLLEYLLDWCADQGIPTLDLTIGDESYKDRWCDQKMQTYEVIQGRSLRGQAYAAPRWLNRAAKNQVKSHPRLRAMADRARG